MANKIHSPVLVIITIIVVNLSIGCSAYGGAYYPGTPPLDIISIEMCNDGLLVVAGDSYYSIADEQLSKIKWESVTVNGNQVFVNTLSNETFTTHFHLLDDDQRDLIVDIKQKSLISLIGLGQTLPPQTSSNYGNSVNSYASNSYGRNIFPGPLNQASQAALNPSASGHNYFAPTYDAGAPVGSASSNYPGAPLNSLTSSPYGSPSGSPLYSSPPSTSGGYGAKTPGGYGDSTPLSGSGSVSSGGGSSSNGYQATTKTTTVPEQNNYVTSPTAYNYYNLNLFKELKETLPGDIYSFSRTGYIVDVFSTTALVHQRSGLSILFKNHHSFSYAQQNMPLEINRFFLTKNTVIFVYNDGTVLAKARWMLNSVEMDLVVGARTKIKELTGRIALAEEFSYKGHNRSHKHNHHDKHDDHHDKHHGHHDHDHDDRGRHHGHHHDDDHHHDEDHGRHHHHHDEHDEKHHEKDHEKHHEKDHEKHHDDHHHHEREATSIPIVKDAVKALR